MDTRTYYSMDEACDMANYLFRMDEQETSVEYEVRIDGLVVIPRTSDPLVFMDHRPFIKDNSRELVVMLYKGNSRVSDKRVYVLSDQPAPEQVPTFEQKVEAALEQYREEASRKYELDKLRGIKDQQAQKIKKQKRKIKRLKQAVADAGTKSEGLAKVLKDLAGSPSIHGLFSKTGSEAGEPGSGLGILPDDVVTGYLKEYREKLGEQTFQELLGTTLTMAQQPELIAQVRAFITDKTKEA